MADPRVVREWLDKADEDYGFAASTLQDTAYFALICFHFQQAAEKYLKAYIVANELEFRPAHNLLELLEICRRREPSFKQLREACRYLNPFYIEKRYPVHWPTNYTREVAQEAWRQAQQVNQFVKRQLAPLR